MSDYEKKAMCELIGIPEEKVHTVHNAINLEGIEPSKNPPNTPTIGFLERQCYPKGLHVLVDAFIRLKKRNTVPNVKLKIAGGMTSEDKKYVHNLKKLVKKHGYSHDMEILPNLSRHDKIKFLHSLSVMSVPAVHKEAFGIYILEALAAGVPVVQPDQGSFPEILKKTGGGILYDSANIEKLVDGLEELLLNKEKAIKLGQEGRIAVLKEFGHRRMAEEFELILKKIT